MVFTTTTLRWYYVLNAATQLLLRCYTDNSRPSTEFIAFTVRLYYDIQDHTTTLRNPRRLYNDTTTVVLIILGFYCTSSMIKRWCAICAYLLGFWNVFYFILRHEKRISDYLSVFVSTINKELGSPTMDFCPIFWLKLIQHNFTVFHFCLLLLPLNSLKHLNWVLLVHVFRANNCIFRPLFLPKMQKIGEFWLFNQKQNISTAQPHTIFHFFGFFVQMSFK